ncbi:uncharacterized protein J3R85_012378 [Psidium guajava]|nr:uncharacterized protein J3R85_012378 [Psidium guajava]
MSSPVLGAKLTPIPALLICLYLREIILTEAFGVHMCGFGTPL